MPAISTVELTDLILAVDLGTYGPQDVVPDHHLLDMTLSIDPARVLIPQDGMAHVFDYDPLIAEIDRLARDGHYETQEWLMTRILSACAACSEVQGVTLFLRKGPVINDSGQLGVRLRVNAATLDSLRQGNRPA